MTILLTPYTSSEACSTESCCGSLQKPVRSFGACLCVEIPCAQSIGEWELTFIRVPLLHSSRPSGTRPEFTGSRIMSTLGDTAHLPISRYIYCKPSGTILAIFNSTFPKIECLASFITLSVDFKVSRTEAASHTRIPNRPTQSQEDCHLLPF